jgi:2-iminobutanoate/2-iminopropanoate deaminase
MRQSFNLLAAPRIAGALEESPPMKFASLLAIAVLLATPTFAAAQVVHNPVAVAAGATPPPFSSTVWAGDTLYVAGTTDGGFKEGDTASAAATRVLNNIKRAVEAAGVTMDDLVWVQVFCSDLNAYADFNTVYRTYFKGPMPARAFLGTNALLNGARFEVMGIAVRPKK